ncbi:MAG: glycosyltransferase [Candidatus Bathyarchaeia archaeon]
MRTGSVNGKDKMKLLSVIHSTQPGGVQRVGAVETAKLRELGYECSLLSLLKTPKWTLFDEININVQYVYESEYSGRFLSGIFLKVNTVTEPDIIIAHNNPGAQVALQLKKGKKDARIVFYLHDSLAYNIALSFFGLLSSFCPKTLRRLERRHIEIADIVLVNSRLTLSEVVKNHGLRSLDKFTVLYPTVNVPISEKDLVKDKKGYVILGGRIDHEAFYNVYRIIKKMDVPLVIAGYGHPHNPNSRKIVRLFESLRRKRNVRLIFSPYDEQLFELYRNASLFIYPGHENFNMNAIEAMSVGCPILVANTSGICEIFPQKLREELCLDKNDVELWIEKIKEIVEGDRAYKVGKECWAVSQNYNLFTHMDRLAKILERVR